MQHVDRSRGEGKSKDLWRRAQEVFLELLDLPEKVLDLPADERADRLRCASGGDQALEAAIGRLLAGHAAQGPVDALAGSQRELAALRERLHSPVPDTPRGTLSAEEEETLRTLLERACGDRPALLEQIREQLSDQATATARQPRYLPAVGERLGPYRVLEELGRGGMGVVFLARREDVDKEVAIKVVTGLGTEARVERALAEQRILAGLEHPSIARFVDAGRTAAGAPFFAMELVSGAPINVAVKERNLTLAETVRVFARVCRAVHYAHQRAVVHRDLKPSNIFLTDEGGIKLLDFGIAKVLDDGESDVALTRTGVRLLTPAYASPEQVRGDTVTTVSDVYSLGVVLYELIAGRSPYADTRPSDVEAAVLERDPPAPSRSRSSRRRSLSSQLASDLDAIVLMALRKEPEHRYASAERMAEDLERSLRRLPVDARSDSGLYRLRRFVRRRWAAVTTTATLLCLIVGWAISASVQARRVTEQRDLARQETRKAETVVDFVLGLFEASDPYVGRGEDPSARELLERGAARAREELAEQPDVKATLLMMLGNVYRNLGHTERANDLLGDARETLAALPLEDREELVMVLSVLGDIALHQAQVESAIAHLEEATALAEKLHGSRSEQLATALENLGRTYVISRRHDQAVSTLGRSRDLWRDLHGAESEHTAWSLRLLGEALFVSGRRDEGLETLRESLRLFHQLPASAPEKRLELLQTVGDAEREIGDLEASRRALEQAVALGHELSADRPHPRLATVLFSFGGLLSELGDREAAELNLRESATAVATIWGEEHAKHGMALLGLARLQADAGDPEAEPLFLRAIEILSRRLPEDHPHMAAIQFRLATFLHQQGRAAEALPLASKVVRIRESHYGTEDPRVVDARQLEERCREDLSVDRF